MSKKYTLKALVSWGKIRDYEAKKLEELGFTDVCYEDRMATINKIGSNYQFWTDTSRSGWTSYCLATINPYDEIFPTGNKKCYSMWQCIKKYLELVGEQSDKN